MKKLLCLVALASLFFSSCSSGDTNPASTALVQKTVLDYSLSNAQQVIEYSYDGNKLQTITRDGELFYEFIYTNDKLTRINYPFQYSYFLIEYDASGKVSQYTEYGNSSAARAEITYSANGFTRTFYSGNLETQENFNGTEIVTIVNGNPTQIYRNFGGLEQTTSYTYDNKNNPFKNISNFDVFRIMEISIPGTTNNPISYDDVTSASSSNYTKAYTYNASNFPTTEQKIYDGFVSTTLTYTYLQ